VLAEGDDQTDPIVDSARGVLDGHILLSREIADGGRYPAIDIESSISRVMVEIVPKEQLEMAKQFKKLYSTYQQNHDLISVGAYRHGADPEIDEAIAKHASLEGFLGQDIQHHFSVDQSLQALANSLS